MFAFGSSEDSARLFMDATIRVDGPGLPEVPSDEMSLQEIKHWVAYTFMALRHGRRDGLDDETMAKLTEWYNEAFLALADASEEFVALFKQGVVQLPFGPTDRPKYFELLRSLES